MVSFTTWLPYPKEKRPCYQLNRAWYLSQHSYSLRAKRSENRIPVGRDFPPVQTDPAAHPASCKMGTESFPGVKYGRGVMLTTHSLLVPWSRKGRAIHLPTLWATTGPVMGTLYLTYWIRGMMDLRADLNFVETGKTWAPDGYRGQSVD